MSDHLDDTDYCARCQEHHATLCPDDVEALARMLYGVMGGPAHEWPELASSFRARYLTDATEVLLWARHGEGRETFARAMDLSWSEGSVDRIHSNPYIPRGRNNGVRWRARRLIGEWENIPYCFSCETYHSGTSEASDMGRA